MASLNPKPKHVAVLYNKLICTLAVKLCCFGSWICLNVVKNIENYAVSTVCGWAQQLNQCCFPLFSLGTEVWVFVVRRCGVSIKVLSSVPPFLRLYAHSNLRTPEHFMINFMVAPCINNIKHFIVQLMHTNYKILRLLK